MICELTGKKTIFGSNISHSNRKTCRKFKANIFKQKFYFETLKRNIKIKISAKGLRLVNKFFGIENCILQYINNLQSIQINRIRKQLIEKHNNN